MSHRYHLQEEAIGAAIQAPDLLPGRIWRVCLIREGWSKNKRYYGRDVLKAAVPLFEGAAVALYRTDAQGFPVSADHLSRSGRMDGIEGPAGNVAGLTANVAFEESGPAGPGVYADFHCTSTEVRSLALAAQQAGVPCPLGLSIDATGTAEIGLAEGVSGLIVTQIFEVLETTLVSNPAAGGRLVRLIASTGNTEEEENMNALRRFLERRLRRTNGNADAVPGMEPRALCEAVASQLQEMEGDKAILQLALEFLKAGKTEEAVMALEKLVATAGSEPEPEAMVEAVASSNTSAFASADQVQRLAEALERQKRESQQFACQMTLRESLASSNLPNEVQSYLRKQFANRIFDNAELAEAINDARQMLASAIPQGGVAVARASVGVEPYDRIVAAVDCMWGSIPEGLQESEAHRQVMRGRAPSIRQICAEYYDDPNCTGRPGPNAILHENTTSTLPYLVGTSINRRVAVEFMARQREYERWVTLDSVSDFKLQDILIEGDLGPLPSVSEGDGVGTATYAYGVLGGEDRVQASVTKFGRVYGLTRELIRNDDMRWLRNLPKKIADAALLTEKTQVLKGLIGNLGGSGINTDTCFTGQVLYSLGHNDNKGTAAFSYAALVAALKKKRNTLKRGAKTTLTGNHNDSTTTITVGATRGFAAGQRFVIDGEIFTISTVDSATQFTVSTRTSANGAAAHTSGAAVRQLLDQAELRQHTLVVPTDLVDTAAEVLASVLKPDTANNNGTALPYLARDIQLQDYHSTFLGNDTDNWYMPAGVQDGEFIHLAHMDGVRTPFVGVAEGQESYNMLMADQTDYKVRFEFLVKVVNPDGSIGYIV